MTQRRIDPAAMAINDVRSTLAETRRLLMVSIIKIITQKAKL